MTLSHLISLCREGGPIAWLLLAVSVAGMALVVCKLRQFHAAGFLWRAPVAPDGGALRLLLARGEAPRGACTPVAGLIHQASGRLAADDFEDGGWAEEVEVLAAEQMRPFEAGLRGIEAIAVLCPLLGLLGTVCGMIVAFTQLEHAQAQVNPSMLAGGIWQALITTAIGLAVAIPAKAALVFLESRLDRVRARLEDVATRLAAMPVVSGRTADATAPSDRPVTAVARQEVRV